MNKIILLFLISFAVYPAPNERLVYVPNDTLPLELRFLIETIQEYPLSSAEKEQIKEIIQTMGQNMQGIDRKILNPFIKSECYKYLLNTLSRPYEITNYRPDLLQEMLKNLEKSYDDYASFTLWFVVALKNDFENIFSSPFHITFIQSLKTNGEITSPEVLRIKKKLTVLIPIFQQIQNLSAEEWAIFLKDKLFSLLSQLATRLQLLHTLTPVTTTSTITFFELKKISIKKKKSKLETLIDAITSEKKTDSPITGWRPKEAVAIFPTPNPNYIAPEKMPEPIDTWLDEFIQIYPTPSPNYHPPKKLPMPISSWPEPLITPTPESTPAAPPIPTPIDPDADWILN